MHKIILSILLALSCFAISYANDDIWVNECPELKFHRVNTTDVEVVEWSNHNYKSVEIPETIVYDGETLTVVGIGKNAFFDWTALETITIPRTVTYIGESAFYNCKALKDITVPNEVTVLAEGVFKDCSGLEYIHIPNSIIDINRYAMSGCCSLKEFTIPESVKTIGECAFYQCSAIEKITIPESVNSLGECVFQGCLSLKEINLSHSIKEIPLGCFWECNSLETLVIPNNVEWWENNATEKCSNLKNIIFEDGESPLVFGQKRRATTYTAFSNDVPAEVYIGRPISNFSTSGLGRKITKVICGSYFREIPMGFCKFCKELQEFTSEYEISRIGESAFYYCEKLTTLNIKKPIYTEIESNCFSNCELLESFEIPSSVTSIGNAAFYNCKGLQKITAFPVIPPAYYYGEYDSDDSSYVFEGVDKKTCILVVPDESLALYKNADIWRDFFNIQSSGIEDVVMDSENATPIYYDLGGRVIASPQNGIYIKKQGRKSTKVFIP